MEYLCQVRATVTKRGQVSIPARLRRKMHLEAGQTVLWEAVSVTECRLIVVAKETITPDPLSALGFARRHGLDEGSADVYLRELRTGEENYGENVG